MSLKNSHIWSGFYRGSYTTRPSRRKHNAL